MNRIYVPSKGPEDWRALLADPEKHWKTGCSAKALAHCWEEASGFPKSVGNVFATSRFKELENLELLLAIPEHKVPLPGGGRPSQNDLMALASNNVGLVCIAVEGKVQESFDRTVAEWKSKASAEKSRKKERLKYICDLLHLSTDSVETLRYQFLHRTASAVIEARRFKARTALMLVHSFSQENAWFDDYKNFVSAFGSVAGVNEISIAGKIDGIQLFLGWAKGEAVFCTK